MMNKRGQWLLWVGITIALVLCPWVVGIYYTNFIIVIAVFSVFSVSYNFLLGFTGLFSFGHAMFFGIGGYGTALALKHINGLPLLASVGMGLLASVVLALILCPIVVRVSGTAFAMLHLAFGELMYVLALKFRNITGGEDGVGGFIIPPLNIPGLVSIDMKAPTNFYYFAISVLAISLGLMWFFTKTPFGQIQTGVRDNVKRIDYLGYKVPQTKAVVYVISAAFAGVAGAIYGLFQNLVSSDGSLSIGISFAVVINTVVGGVGSFSGPIWGTAIMQILQELITRYTERVELVQGMVLVLTILFAPQGLTGLIALIKQRWFFPSVPKKEGLL